MNITRIEKPKNKLPSFEQAENYALSNSWFKKKDIDQIFYGYEGEDETGEAVFITLKDSPLNAAVWFQEGEIYGEY